MVCIHIYGMYTYIWYVYGMYMEWIWFWIWFCCSFSILKWGNIAKTDITWSSFMGLQFNWMAILPYVSVNINQTMFPWCFWS